MGGVYKLKATEHTHRFGLANGFEKVGGHNGVHWHIGVKIQCGLFFFFFCFEAEVE